MTDILNAAMGYAKRGWKVFPLEGKIPLKGSKGFKDATLDGEKIKTWFSDEKHNIGIATGKISGIFVLDVDNKAHKNKYGDEELKEIESAHQAIPETVEAMTPSGGRHLYFNYPEEGIGNRADFRNGLDVRGDGGYCFTAGHRIAVRPHCRYSKCTKSIPIENIRVGDIVMSLNENTGEIESNKVLRIGNRIVDKTIMIKFGRRESVLNCSKEHPIFTTHGWKNADKITSSDELLHFNRQQLLFGRDGHQFSRGVQSKIGSKTKNYQKEYRQRTPNHLHYKSKYEDFLETIIQKEKLPVSFVGDGSLIINHKDLLLHPDFVVNGKKKVIEVHIDFHSQKQKDGEKKTLRTTTQKERKKMYETEGWECLLLNANEWQAFNKETLNVIENVRKKLINFVCNGKKIDFVHTIYGKETVYNIEVENNHNYFTCGINGGKQDWYLVHNCVAPPSQLNGIHYEWEASSHPDDIPIADAPVWLMGIMKTKASVAVTSSTANIDEGSRDDALTKIAGTLHAQAHLDTEDLYNALLIINMKRCNPPLLDKDIMKIAKSVNSYPKLPDSFFEPLTDSWNGRMLCKMYGQDIKFCDGLGGWFKWTERNWQVDKKFKMYRTCQEVSNKLLRRSAMMNNDDKQKKIIYKHAVSMQAENKINSMLRLARCENGITHDTDDFDNNPWLFNCHNGTLHLKSDAFYPQKRDDLITRGLEIPFEHKAECPEWMKFLRSVFLEDDDLILFMQKAVGYALSGNVSEDCMFMFYGNGSNGKSTFLKHLLNILGAYAITTPADTLLEKKGDAPLNDIARLKGHRFVSCVESARARYMDEARVKQMTGGDIIPARFLYREYFEFYSTFKIFFATNNLPIVSEFSDGIWRRLLPIPFNNQYLAGDRDMKLDMKLSQEYAGILRWAIEGFRLWSDNGLGTTPCIDKLKAEYRAESNLVDTFITEKCTVDHDSDYVFTSSVDIWKVFHEWNIGMGGKRYKQKEFYDYLKNKGFDKMKNSADHGRHYFSGIMVRAEEEEIKKEW